MNHYLACGNKRRHLIAASLATAFLLSACGGGSGGASSGNQSAVSVAPSATPLVLTSANAPAAGQLAMGFGVIGLGLAQAAVDWSHGLNTANGMTQQVYCSGGGTATMAFNSAKAQTTPSPGDQLTITLNSCYVKPMEDVFTGVMTIAYQTPATGYQQSAVVSLQPGFSDKQSTTITLNGQLAFDYNADTVSKAVHVYSTTTPFGITVSSGTNSAADTLTAINSVRNISLATGRTATSISYSSASNILQGSYSVSTPLAYGSWFDTYPDVGTITVNGASGSTVGLTAINGDQTYLNVTLNNLLTGQVQLSQLPSYAFSGAGWITQDNSGQSYANKPASQQGFAVLQQPVLSPVNPQPGGLTWIFSRPVGTNFVIGANFHLLPSCPSRPWVASVIPGTVTISGATLTITPSAQLQPGCSYQVALTSAQSEIANNSVVDVNSDSVQMGNINVVVSQAVYAEIDASGPPVLLGPNSNLGLNALNSHALGMAAPLIKWTQLSGPAVNIQSTSDQLFATITPTSSANGIALIQLTVTDASGDIDIQQISIPVLTNLTNAVVIDYTDPNTPNTVFTNLNNSAVFASSVNYNSTTTLDVGIGFGQGRLLFSGGANHVFAPGDYFSFPNATSSGANLVWIPPNDLICQNPAATIQIDAISYSGNTLTSLALTFNITCNNQVFLGRVRFNSNLQPFAI